MYNDVGFATQLAHIGGRCRVVTPGKGSNNNDPLRANKLALREMWFYHYWPKGKRKAILQSGDDPSPDTLLLVSQPGSSLAGLAFMGIVPVDLRSYWQQQPTGQRGERPARPTF